ncbi:MAG: hypothetical protein WC333_02675 [Dehalococcoidia bacterium]|jgi:hypothetical protein
MEGLIIGIVVGIIIAGIGLIIASKKRGSVYLGAKSGQRQSFSTAGSPKETLKAICLFAKETGYKIAAIDEPKGQVVFEESASLLSWGFFFPVSVTQQSNGSTLVEVGIESKLVQVGPIVSRNHKRCVKGIKSALSIQN